MAVVAISDSILTDIADAIRSKNGTENTYKPSQMPDAIEAISSGGITPTGTKEISITQNGTTTEDVTNYENAEITVNVSGGGTNNIALLFQGVKLGEETWQLPSCLPQIFNGGGYLECIADVSNYTFQSTGGIRIISFGGTINAWSPPSNDAVFVHVYSSGEIRIIGRGSITGEAYLTPNAQSVYHFKLYKDKVVLLDGTTEKTTGNTEITLSGNILQIMTNICSLSRISVGNKEGNASGYYKDPIDKVAFYSA